MPETIQLLLKELRLPTFSRHYLIHQEQALAKVMGIFAIYLVYANKKPQIVIKNVYKNGREKPDYHLEKALLP